MRHGQAPARTVELASRAAADRPTAESFRILAEAHLAAGDLVAAQKEAERSLAAGERTARLLWTGARIADRAGQTAQATRLRPGANALNPAIERMGP